MNVNELVLYLKKCDDAYYNSSKTLVSNDTYDALVKSLSKMDPDNPYLNKVGAKVNDSSNKVGRINPMGTLSKYHNDDEVLGWLEDHKDSYILMAPKYDGFGIELVYENGRLILASTRGTGYVGEDVTDAVKNIKNIPVTLPTGYEDLVIVRGEAIIPRLNHDRVKELGYTAMRNAVPGIVRSNREDALPFVDFVAYEFFDRESTRTSSRERFSSLFNVETYELIESNNFDKFQYVREHYGEVKDSYIYEIDGMVLKTDTIHDDDLLNPKHQIAWKFKSNRRETVLRSIEFQIGVTGKITPIAVFDSVEFQGASLTRASLGSVDRYKELKPCVGDIIEVSRRGDIIPYCEDVIERRGETSFNPLDNCPFCGSELIGNSCLNKSCSEKLDLQIRNYVGSIGVKGIGPSLVKALINKGVVNKLSDVYKVTRDDIVTIPRQGESSANKWQMFIDKEISLLEFFCALPFDNLGKKVFETLLSRWSYEELMNISESDILDEGLKGIGQTKAVSFIEQRDMYKEDILEMCKFINIK